MIGPTIRVLPYVGVFLLILFLGSSLHSCGVEKGANSTQKKWDKEKRETDQEIRRLEKSYASLQKTHREETQRITHELSEERRRHEVELVRTNTDYDHRLRLSESRAEVYQRQARNGSIECRNLADHASRLDSSLEEGRSLVRELRSTLGLRESQIRALSQQIHTDRLLFTANEYPEGSPDG